MRGNYCVCLLLVLGNSQVVSCASNWTRLSVGTETMSHIQEDTNAMASTSHGWNFQVNTPPRIIIVGGGLAGLSATLEAVNQGAHVTLIEKNPKLGGNSEKASSGMNAVGMLLF